jgi:ELWxxDGT repeat protein
MLKLHIALLGLVLGGAPVAAAPYLVKDLNTGPAETVATYLYDVAAAGPVLYFPGSDPAHGAELWRTDGTAAGTYRVTDVCAGRCDSSPDFLRAIGTSVYFQADDGVSGRELWVSDGTPGHEHRVRDLCAGPCDSDPGQMTAVGGTVVFAARLGQRSQLWRTDGTRAGTSRLATLCIAADDCVANPTFQSIGERAFFEIFVESQLELWETDGTAAGTFPVKNVASGLGAGISAPLAGPGFLFVWTASGLWRSDGTAAGTYEIKALADLPATFDPTAYRAVVSGGVLYAVLGAGVVVRSDGTPAGTFVLHTFPTGAEVTALAALSEGTSVGIVLAVRNPGPPSSTLWVSRGTPESTAAIAGPPPTRFIDQLTSLGDRVLFRVLPGIAASAGRLWTTDGTAAGTVLVAGTRSVSGSPLAAAGGEGFYFQDGLHLALWAVDGASAHAVHDFSAGPGSSGPLDQTAFAGTLLFSARTSPTEVPLFRSDGTAAGTGLVSDQALSATGFTLFAGKVYFGAGSLGSSPTPGTPPAHDSFWRTDGTPAGTVRLAATLFENPKQLGSQLLFSGGERVIPFPSADRELWRTDGTVRGTRLLENIDPYDYDSLFHDICVGASSAPGPGVLLGNRFVFAADDGVHGRELWSTDGTAKGTRLVADINRRRSPEPPASCPDGIPDPQTDSGVSSNPEGFAKLGSGTVALFAADDGTTGRELWATDGTAQGTRRVADLFPGPMGSSPHDLTRLGNLIYFLASPTGIGDALYRTDGTNAGTVLVSNLQVNGAPSWAQSLTVSGGKLFFVVYNETSGAELWTSLGTPASTRLVADLAPGPASSSPQLLTDVSGILLFAADDGAHGLELWRTDGTEAGTRLLGDINPGPASSSPGPFTIVGGRVFFGADDGAHGRELWAIPLADVLASHGQGTVP